MLTQRQRPSATGSILPTVQSSRFCEDEDDTDSETGRKVTKQTFFLVIFVVCSLWAQLSLPVWSFLDFTTPNQHRQQEAITVTASQPEEMPLQKKPQQSQQLQKPVLNTTIATVLIPSSLPQASSKSIDSVQEENQQKHIQLQPQEQNQPQEQTQISKKKKKTVKSKITILVELAGEFGNELSFLSYGVAVQKMAKKHFGIETEIVLRRALNGKKYLDAQEHLQDCFPSLRRFDFHSLELPVPDQSAYLKGNSTTHGDRIWDASQLQLKGGSTIEDTMDTLQTLHDILKEKGDDGVEYNHYGGDGDKDFFYAGRSHHATISFPYIQVNSMVNREFMDTFYDDFREYFKFDENKCCGDLPEPGEAVFHFRNFLKDLKKGKSKGLEELSPHKLSTEVFASGKTLSNKLAIVTRHGWTEASQAYLDEFPQNVTSTKNHTSTAATTTPIQSARLMRHTAMQDFCAMRHADELVGTVRSTFVVWAGLLGYGRVRLYSVESPATVAKFREKGRPYFRTYNWTHPELKKRIHFELYQSEEREEQLRQLAEDDVNNV